MLLLHGHRNIVSIYIIQTNPKKRTNVRPWHDAGGTNWWWQDLLLQIVEFPDIDGPSTASTEHRGTPSNSIKSIKSIELIDKTIE